MTKNKPDRKNTNSNSNKGGGRVFQYKKTKDARNEGGRNRGGRGRYNDGNGRDNRDYPRDHQGKRRDRRGDQRGYRNDNNMSQNQYHNNGNRIDPETHFNQYKENEVGFAYEVKRSTSGVNFEPIPLMSVKVPPPQTSTPQPSTSQPTEAPVAKNIRPICGTEASLSQNQNANNTSGSEPSSPSPEPESKPKPEVKSKTEAKSKPNIMIDVKKIKKEKPDPVPTPPPKKVVSKKESSSDSSSSSSDSSSSESSEESVPPMPKPLKSSKKEKSNKGDDVVCLGKQENIASLIDDTECLVCQSDSHSSGQCTKKCIKCSHSSYSTQIVCNTCGETYPPKANATATTAPNPFLMFMQFMQFCMGQYFDVNKEMSQPIPGPPPVFGNSQEVEVTRQDIVDNARRHRKKSKSEAKNRKKRKSEKSSDSESDSDSSSKATVSTKKRKKITAPQASTPLTTQSRPQMMPNMTGALPSMQNYPFGAGFNNTGFNPMMAFSQMMGMQPGAAMNFPQ